MITYFVLGALAGAVTGMPVGMVGVAVIDGAYRHGVRRGVAIGIGGGTGDALYAAIGILGLGPILVANADLAPVLYAVSGVALIVYGWIRLRAPIVPLERDGAPRARSAGWGAWVGFGLVLGNPANLITWVVIVGGLLSEATMAEGLAAVVGVGVGSAGWFSVMALLAHRGSAAFGERVGWVGRCAGLLLVGYGVYSLGRGLRGWL